MSERPRPEVLFAYGLLLDPEVQRDVFGRTLDGVMDVLPGYTVDYFETDDGLALDTGPGMRPFVRHTGQDLDKVVGRATDVTDAELDAADLLANASFRRLAVELTSGRRAWVYLRP